MKRLRKRSKFQLIAIPAIDARRGYTRCEIGGSGAFLGNRHASAWFWRDKDGRFIVRFENSKGRWHFDASIVPQALRERRKEEQFSSNFLDFIPVSDKQIDSFEETIAKILYEWARDYEYDLDDAIDSVLPP